MNNNSIDFTLIKLKIRHNFIEVAFAHYEKDEAVKAKQLAAVKKETIPFYTEKLEDLAKENNGHLALGKVNVIKFHIEFY